MIESIRSEGQGLSIYDRYALYKEYQKTFNVNAKPNASQLQVQSPQTTPVVSSVPGEQKQEAGRGDVPSTQLAQQVGQSALDRPRQTADSTPVPVPASLRTAADMANAPVAKRECQTCNNRTYQDRSDDPGVSMQTPTKIDPDKAGSAVRAHENEHVNREQAKAKREGREVVSQSVIVKTAICPECGKVYISGGTTTTVTRAVNEKESLYYVNEPGSSNGRYVNRSI